MQGTDHVQTKQKRLTEGVGGGAVSTSIELAVISEARHPNRFFQIISKPCKQTTKKKEEKKKKRKTTGLSPSPAEKCKTHRTQDQNTGGTPKVPHSVRYSQQILRKPREGKYNHILFTIIIKNKPTKPLLQRRSNPP